MSRALMEKKLLQILNKSNENDNNSKSNTVTIKFTILLDNEPLPILMFIENVSIIEDFIGSLTTEINITFKTTFTHNYIIEKNIEKLTGRLQIIPLTHDASRDIDKEPIIFEGILIYPDERDRSISESPELNNGLPEYEVTLSLLFEKYYNARHAEFSSIFTNNTTVEGAMVYIASHFNFDLSKLNIVKPIDNTRTYKNMMLPPGLKFADIYTYLQENYGVYNHGISTYYNGSTLYIFPPFKTSNDKNIPIDIYQNEKNIFSDFSSYHVIEDGVLTLVCESTDIKKLSKFNSEDGETAIQFMPSKSVPYNKTYMSGNEVFYKESHRFLNKLENVKNFFKKDVKTNIRSLNRPTDNITNINTSIVAGQADSGSFFWNNSVYGIIRPYTFFRFFYTTVERIKRLEGQVIGITYNYNLVSKSYEIGNGLRRFFCKSTIAFRSNPNIE